MMSQTTGRKSEIGTPWSTRLCCSASNRSRRLATATTFTPAMARASQIAHPMPALAPVTNATLPRHLLNIQVQWVISSLTLSPLQVTHNTKQRRCHSNLRFEIEGEPDLLLGSEGLYEQCKEPFKSSMRGSYALVMPWPHYAYKNNS